MLKGSFNKALFSDSGSTLSFVRYVKLISHSNAESIAHIYMYFVHTDHFSTEVDEHGVTTGSRVELLIMRTCILGFPIISHAVYTNFL